MLGLSNNLIHDKNLSINVDYAQIIIDAFKIRILTDNGTFEAESCLKNTLITLNNIN